MRTAIALCGLANGVLLGCEHEVVLSALVESRDMRATYSITTLADDTIEARATFRWISGNARVLLDDGDTIKIDGFEPADLSLGEYSAGVEPAALHVFVLERPRTGPIEHGIATPAPFELTSPPFDGTYDTLVARVTWTPFGSAAATVRIVAIGAVPECPSVTLVDAAPDAGSFEFSGVKLKPFVQSGLPPACNFVLQVSRVARADANPSPLAEVELIEVHKEETSASLR